MTSLRGLSRAALTALLAVPFLDESEAGVVPTALPELAADVGVAGPWAFAVITAALFPLVFLVEAPIFARVDRSPAPHRWLRGALIAIAGACVAAAVVPGLIGLALTLALFGPASGVACGLAQGAYVTDDIDHAERRMARWTLAGAVGDLAGPGLVALVLTAGLPWRAAFVAVAIASLGLALRVPVWPPSRGVAADADDAPASPLREAIRLPGVWPWCVAAAACTFLDEIVLAYGALHIESHGGSAGARTMILGALVVGSAIGLVVFERRADAWSPRTTLVTSAVATVIAVPAWVWAPTVGWAAVAAGVVGCAGAMHYPLAQAQCYRAAPERPGAVNAIAALLLPLEIVIPVALAAVAHVAGPDVALLALATQPLVILAVTIGSRAGRR